MRKRFLSAIAILSLSFAVGCAYSRYPIDEHPLIQADARLEGRWHPMGKSANDVYIVKKKNDYEYAITIIAKDWDKTKLNAFFSDINDSRFLNIYEKKDSGYLFLRILDLNPSADLMTATMVEDSTMVYLSSSTEVRTRITDRLNNREFYSDTIQLRKEK